MMRRFWWSALFFLLTSASLFASVTVTFAPPKSGHLDTLVPVMAQSARCAAVSDVHNLLAFGHGVENLAAHVSLVRLDAKGNPAAYTIPLKLPRPKGLEKFAQYVTGVAFHPKLPRLYVWQDIPVPYTNPPPPAPPEIKDFDHLHVFDVSKEMPELLVSFCRGPEFIYGQQGGGIAVDPTGSYLYVPNLRELKNPGSMRLGRFPLDVDGVPAMSEKDAKEPLAVRCKRLMELNAAKPLLPPQMTPIEYVNLFSLSVFGCGHAFQPLSKDVVIAGLNNGLVTWRPEDKEVTVHSLALQYPGRTEFVVHPRLPVLFAAPYHVTHSDSLFRVEQVEGYLTLLPRQYVIPESKLASPPAILSKQSKVAVGGQYQVYVVNLDEKGFPIGEVTQVQVNCPQVHALVYSERYDRLYAGVDVSK